MNQKKIIFVTHLFYPACGGVETHITRLSKALALKGYQVKALTTNAYSTEAFFLNDKRRIEKKVEVIDSVDVERLGFRVSSTSFPRPSAVNVAILWRIFLFWITTNSVVCWLCPLGANLAASRTFSITSLYEL